MCHCMQWVTGHPAPDSSPLVLSVQQASGRGDWQTVGAHCFASGVIGPLWEEVSARGVCLCFAQLIGAVGY